MKCYYFESNEEFSCNLKIIMKNYHYDTTLRSVNDTGERMKNKNLRVYCLFSSEIVEDGKTGSDLKQTNASPMSGEFTIGLQAYSVA